MHYLFDRQYRQRAWIRGEEADFDKAVRLFFGEGDSILENYKNFGLQKLNTSY